MIKNLSFSFLKGIAAGASIGFGGFLYILMVFLIPGEGGKVLGSLLFAVGLFTVCSLSLHLYTGKIGLIYEKKQEKVETDPIVVPAQEERYDRPYRSCRRFDDIYDDGVHYRTESEYSRRIRLTGNTALEWCFSSDLYRICDRYDLHGFPCEQTVRHGAGYGSEHIF